MGLAAVIASRISLHRAVTVLGWSSVAFFSAGALFWMFGDTYRYYFTSKADCLRISYWGSVHEDAVMREIVDKFQKMYPEIPVKREYYTGVYEEKIQQLLLANEAPDVMQFQDETLPRFIQSGKFEILDDYCQTPGLEIDLEHDYWPTAVACHQYKGTTYGIPIRGGLCLILYNREMFRQINIPEPHDNWTMEEFLDTARKLTADVDGDGRLDRYGFQIPSWIYWLPFHFSFGADYLDSTRTIWTLWGPEALASYTFLQDLRFRYRVSPTRNELEQVPSYMLFLTGCVGMFVGGPWDMTRLDAADMDYGVAQIPIGPAGRATRVTWDSLVMFTGSKKKDWAWKFIHFVASKAGQDIIGKYRTTMPALKASSEEFVRNNKRDLGRRWVDALEYSRVQPVSNHWMLMNREIKSETDMMLDNRQSPMETIRRLAVNPDLSKYFIMPDVQADQMQR